MLPCSVKLSERKVLTLSAQKVDSQQNKLLNSSSSSHNREVVGVTLAKLRLHHQTAIIVPSLIMPTMTNDHCSFF